MAVAASGSGPIEVEPSLYAARTSRTSATRSRQLLRAGCRVFHFDVGDGHFVEPITMGPIVARVDLAADPPLRRRDRRAPDGRAARPSTSSPSQRPAATASPFHFEAVERRRRRRSAPRASTGCRSGSPSTRRPSPEAVGGRRAPTPTSCSAWRSIPATRASRSCRRPYDRVRRLRAALPDAVLIQVDGGVGGDEHRAAPRLRCDAARRRRRRSSATRISPRAYRGLVHALA